MTILIDNGHGSGTPGKRSPDGLFREYSYTREIARRVVFELTECDYDVLVIHSARHFYGLKIKGKKTAALLKRRCFVDILLAEGYDVVPGAAGLVEIGAEDLALED